MILHLHRIDRNTLGAAGITLIKQTACGVMLAHVDSHERFGLTDREDLCAVKRGQADGPVEKKVQDDNAFRVLLPLVLKQ